ncbi:MAG: hypothetical protein WAM14_16240 [Candidatus Nitrosopolaris sp.]
MLNDKTAMALASALVAVFMMSASIFPRMAYAQMDMRRHPER